MFFPHRPLYGDIGLCPHLCEENPRAGAGHPRARLVREVRLRTRDSTLLALLCAGTALACAPSLGPFRLAPAAGAVVDRETGAPIPEAVVLQSYRGVGRSGAPPPRYHVRAVRTDGAGRFAFERAVAPSARMWLLRTDGPRYAFAHAEYGLVRAGARAVEVDGDGGGDARDLTLEGSRSDAQARRLDLETFCRETHPREVGRLLAAGPCPPRAERPQGAERR